MAAGIGLRFTYLSQQLNRVLSENVLLQIKEKVELPCTSRMQISLLIREGKPELNNAEEIHVALECLIAAQFPNQIYTAAK
jgi:hypothetical protein